MSGALTGLRVVERSESLAGAMLGMLLADHGADVVVVEGRDRGVVDAILGRGKARIHPSRSEWDTLVARADVVIEDDGPTWVRGEHARLVHCRIPAFHDSEEGASDAAIGASVGLHDPPVGLEPRFVPIPLPSMVGALYAATGVMAALLARERDGWGQQVVVPRQDALFSLIEFRTMFTVSPPRLWTTLQWAGTPFIGPYLCADGRTLFLHAGLGRHARTLLEMLGGEAAALLDSLHPDTLRDASGMHSIVEAARTRSVLAAAFRTRGASEWETLLGDAGLCAVVCRTGAEWLQHPQATESGQVVTRDDPDLGPVTQVGVSVVMSATPGSAGVRGGRTSVDAVLQRWDPVVAAVGVPSSAPPLEGVKIIDLCQVIAGPAAGRTLAELGAEVLRIEHPRFEQGWVDAFHTAYNPGKRSAMIDLATVGGRLAFWKVASRFSPDVVLHNLRPGVSSRLGLDHPSLRDRWPSVISASVSAYGEEGPWARWAGWEQNAQATTGMQMDYGIDGPELIPLPCNDMGTGLNAAFGVLMALWVRRRDGEGQAVSTSLSGTATLLQSPYLWLWRRQSGDRTGDLGPASRWRKMAAAVTSEDAVSRGLSRREFHEGIGEISLCGPPTQLSRTPLVTLPPARPRGADTAAVLAEVGLPAPDQASEPSKTDDLAWMRAQAYWAAWIVYSRLVAP